MAVFIRVKRRPVPFAELPRRAQARGFFETEEGMGHSTSFRNKRLGLLCLAAGGFLLWAERRWGKMGAEGGFSWEYELAAALLLAAGVVLLLVYRTLLFDRKARELVVLYWLWPFFHRRIIPYSKLRGWGTTHTEGVAGAIFWRVKGTERLYLVYRNGDRRHFFANRSLRAKDFHQLCTWLRFRSDLELVRL